jgi:hypothetical protein
MNPVNQEIKATDLLSNYAGDILKVLKNEGSSEPEICCQFITEAVF